MADNPLGTNVDVNRKPLSFCPFVAGLKKIALKSYFYIHFFHVSPYEPPHDKTNKMACAPSDTLAKYNTTSNNRLKFIQTGSHTIFHWFIWTCILKSTAVAIHTQMYRLLKFSAWTLLLRTKYSQPVRCNKTKLGHNLQHITVIKYLTDEK